MISQKLEKPLTLTLSRRERGLTEVSCCITSTCKIESTMDSTQRLQVDVLLKYLRIGPLSPRERAGRAAFR
jgi:hypothetical protein